ncbi:MAG: hypothetical protein V4733_04385 [Verrucomicrobiota bacterium]
MMTDRASATYCHGDPVNNVDVLGLAKLSVDAPANQEIEKAIDILVGGIKGNEAWIYRKKDFRERIASLFDGEDQLVNQLDRDKREVKFLKTILQIRNSIGANDYGTTAAWSAARRHFGDNLPESVVSHYLKPEGGLLTTPAFREFSRLQDATAQVVVGTSMSFLPFPGAGLVGGTTARAPAVAETVVQAGNTTSALERILYPSYRGTPGFAPGHVINPFGRAANGPMTTLYRAVGPDELADISKTGQLINKGSAEGKYFTSSAEHASDYAQQAVRGFRDPPYTTIRTEVPTSSLPSPTSVDGGIPAFVIPNNALPGMKPTILDWMAVPRTR